MYENIQAIQAEIARHKLSFKKLARIIGLREPTFASKMLGFSTWESPELEKMSDYFQVSIDYLLGREGKFDKGS